MRMTAATLALCLFPALAWAADDHDDHDHEHDDHATEEAHEDHAHDADNDEGHLSEVAGVRLLHPWGVMHGADLHVYIEIQNGSGKEIVIVGGDSAHGDMSLVATDPSNGEGQKIGAIPVAADREMDFAPGELYLLLEDAPDLHEGDHLEAHLKVEPMGEVEIEIEIYAPGTTEHPHAGHNH